MLVEHARNVIGISDAYHAESGDNRGGTPLITLLSCSLDGRTIDIDITQGSQLEQLHRSRRTTEHTTCNYGLSPAWQHVANDGGMRVSAVDDTSDVRAIERVDHPFFMGTLYQPQLRSTAHDPHPIFTGFLNACRR